MAVLSVEHELKRCRFAAAEVRLGRGTTLVWLPASSQVVGVLEDGRQVLGTQLLLSLVRLGDVGVLDQLGHTLALLLVVLQALAHEVDAL